MEQGTERFYLEKAHIFMNYLYHGSITPDIKVLEPRHRFVPAGKINYDAIYATPLPLFAVMQSFPWSSDEGIDVIEENNNMTLIIPRTLESRLSVPVSIYKISDEEFIKTIEETTGLTWHTTKPIIVLEEIKYPNIIDAIKSNGGSIIYT